MKKVKSILVALLIIGISSFATAQKFKVISGSCDFMKGINKLNLKFDYSDMSVGKFKNEADYIAKKKKEYNDDESGRGDEWEKAWIQDRSERYEPRLVVEMNQEFDKRGLNIKAGKDIEAKYTLIFKTTFTEPGFNVGVMRRDALVNGEAIFVETANPKKVVAKILVEKSPGRAAYGYDYDTGLRIQEAYAEVGEELTYFIWKKYLK